MAGNGQIVPGGPKLIPEGLSSSPADFYEDRAHALYLAAFQAENPEEFVEKTRESIGNYEKADKIFGGLTGAGNNARSLRCQAMTAYLASWLASEASEKKKLLEQSWRVARDALKILREAGETLEYGRTYNQLVISTSLLVWFEPNSEAMEKILTEALEHGEEAVKFLSTHKDPSNLAIACVRTATCIRYLGVYFVDIDQADEYFVRALDYWRRANELSEEQALLELSNFHTGALASTFWETATHETLTKFGKALELARSTGNKLTIGGSLDWLAYHTFWAVESAEDPDERLQLSRKSLKYAEEARDNYSRICFTSSRAGSMWTGEPHTEHYWSLALWETSPPRRRDLLEKALEAAPILLKRAEDSGFPEAMGYAHHVTSKVMTSLAKIETASEKSRRLLEEALKHRSEDFMSYDHFYPFRSTGVSFNRGVSQNYLADIKSEMADLAKDAETRRRMLQEAILDKEASLKLHLKYMQTMESAGRAKGHLYGLLGMHGSEYGNLRSRLYELTKDKADINKAIAAFEEAAELLQKRGLNSRIAECHWKTAELYDVLGEHMKAADNFLTASNYYNLAEQTIPRLQVFYQDHARYMDAWSEIEKQNTIMTDKSMGMRRNSTKRPPTYTNPQKNGAS